MPIDREGDKICLIGFSRGAYTARALAGMLHKVGLLPAHNQAQIPFAYKWYKDNSHYGWDMRCVAVMKVAAADHTLQSFIPAQRKLK